MTKPKLFAALAKVVIATAFGGPFEGSKAAANQAVDLVAGWLGNDRSPTYESTLARMQAGLERLAQAENISPAQVEQALTQGRDMIVVHGLGADEMTSLDLNADRVSATVLARAEAELKDMDEAARGMCRLAIRSAYSTMLSSPEALPELERAFQRAVLTRLTELKGQPADVVLALKAAVGTAAVITPRMTWRSDIFPPSALLRAEYAVVPFFGREDVLSDLIAWTETDRALSIRLYTGPGGMGKTRLMIECCQRLPHDWRAGFLSQEVRSDGWLFPLDATFELSDRLLVVVDYAETRAAEVQALVRRALQPTKDRPVRLILLARAEGDWWRDLKRVSHGVGDVLSGPATDVRRLPPVAQDPEQRSPLFDRAAAAFAAVLAGSSVPASPPSLEADYYDRVLYVLLMALAAVQGVPIKTENGLLDFALSREQNFLDEGIAAAGCEGLRGRPILQCAAVATLAGRAGDLREAMRLISGAPLLKGQPEAVIAQVAELLHRLYPGEAWLQGVLPDLLGEHVVERAIEEDDCLIEAAFGSAQ